MPMHKDPKDMCTIYIIKKLLVASKRRPNSRQLKRKSEGTVSGGLHGGKRLLEGH